VEPPDPLDALQTERRRHERVEASLREQLRVMVAETAEFMGRLEGYEMRRAELEKELSWERLLHRETRRTLAQAEREVDDAQHRAADMRRRVEERDELLGLVRASVDDGSTRLGDLEERLMELREASEADAPPAGANGHEPALSARQAAVLDRVRGEAEAGLERLSDLEERVIELRAAILSAAAVETTRTEPPRRRRRFLRS
jgi:chromosome segregation ATPase